MGHYWEGDTVAHCREGTGGCLDMEHDAASAAHKAAPASCRAWVACHTHCEACFEAGLGRAAFLVAGTAHLQRGHFLSA